MSDRIRNPAQPDRKPAQPDRNPAQPDRKPAQPDPDPVPFGDDFLPEDFAAAGLSISTDFVARTNLRVLEDLARIRQEADAVESVQLSRDLLDAFAPPPAQPDFTSRMLGRLRDERLATDSSGEDGAVAALRPAPDGAEPVALPASEDGLLFRYAVPRVSPDFVQRTLDALRVERDAASSGHQADPRAVAAQRQSTSHRRSTSRVRPAPIRRLRPALRWAAVAAALALTALFLVSRRGAPDDGDPGIRTNGGPVAVGPIVPSPRFVSLQDASPTRISTAFARIDDRGEGGLRLEPIDPLLMLVADGGRDR